MNRTRKLVTAILGIFLLCPVMLSAGPLQDPSAPQGKVDYRTVLDELQQGPVDTPAIRVSRSEAQTMWEFKNQYAGADKVTRLLNSFAVGQLLVQGGGWCSGVMISPHIFMTAAHCGGPEWTGFVRFFRIDEDSATPGPAAQDYSQLYNAQTFPWQSFTNHDTNLWWVEDGSDGIPPGITYGYLELSPEATEVGDQAYSFWVNPVDNFNGTRLEATLLHSSGSVNAVGTVTNFTDFGNMYTAPGASGSVIIGTGRHGHQAIGVTAVGPLSGGSEGPGRRAADTRYFLNHYDSDRNNVLDAIEYDFFFTRAARNFYRLDFDTPLQRAQWRRAGAAAAPGAPSGLTSAPGFWVGRVVGSASQETNDGLWHSTARFAPNGTYRISLLVYGLSHDNSPAYIKLRSDIGRSDVLLTFEPVVNAWQRLTFRATLGNYSDYRLILGQLYGGEYYVESVAILREQARLDFENGDERRSWEYVGGSYVTSWGINGPNDFSGVVVGPSPSDTKWSLRNRYAALRANRTYEITFDTKHVSGPLSGVNFISIQNLSGVVAFNLPWTFNSNGETRTITMTASTGNELGNAITFGTFGTGAYLVDNIRIRERQ